MVTVVPLFQFVLCSNILSILLLQNVDDEKMPEREEVPKKLELLSYKQETAMSASESIEYSSKYAVDGDKSQNTNDKAVKCSYTSGWWKVYVGRYPVIKTVVVYGGIRENLEGTKVQILDFENSEPNQLDEKSDAFDCTSSINGSNVLTAHCNIIGRFVRLVNYYYFTLCEVEVWGHSE